MPDPITIIGAAGILSTMISAGGLYKATRASVELVRLEAPPIGQVLDHAFGCGTEIPAELGELLAKLD